MANYNELTLNTSAPKKLGNDLLSKTVVVDFAVINDGAGVGATDTVEILKVPKGAVMISVLQNVITAEGGVATADLGDNASATTYHSNLDINAVALTAATTQNIVYTAADTIKLTADTAATGVAKIHYTFVYAIDETLASA
jgi:hypothetical protein